MCHYICKLILKVFVQGDFDIVGGTCSLAEAEVIKVRYLNTLWHGVSHAVLESTMESYAEGFPSKIWFCYSWMSSCRHWNLALIFFLGRSANSVRHQVATEVISKFSILELDEVRVNHRHLLNAVWNWAGVKRDERLQIAQVSNSTFL
jgi:hypothetical protein